MVLQTNLKYYSILREFKGRSNSGLFLLLKTPKKLDILDSICYTYYMKYTNVIYCHKNKINGRCYIGSTIQDTKKRWRKSDKSYSSYKTCTVFYRALKKYGWDNFDTDILMVVFSEDDLSLYEGILISSYNSVAPNGYNTVSIIEGRVKYTEETKKKISESRKKYYENLEYVPVAVNRKHHKNIGDVAHKHCVRCGSWKILASFGNNKRNWDKLHRYCKPCHIDQTSKYKKAYNLSKEDLKKSYENRKTVSRPIIATKLSGESIKFESTMGAHRAGYRRGSIRTSINTGKLYKGYIWRFVDEDIERLFARKCKIKTVEAKEESLFLKKYHRQFYAVSKICYGLYYNGELVCLMSFGHSRFDKNYEWEIIRLCSKNNLIVVGGASRLLKAFVREYNPNNILTYAHLDYGKAGEVYKKLGFKHIGTSQSSYEYKKGRKILSRYRCQKHKLHKILKEDFDPSKTEKQNMIDAGYERKVLPGNNKFIWKK